ncbi:hypothetical protein Ddye_024214 [Dipteronia dyeriana]|uniref:Reverse transcriptase domain-containing protein n=1 Tax=Dipteronia dyeriana TaxID=168575 RepID=A0AAD9WTD2_9ROSI|nr:hypothetical protein Ddye_024214 [Dipteronia dyeriana]
MMLKLGFSEGWVAKVMNCVSTVSFSFVINGDVCGSVKPSRGIRQGDPLSPYLFLLCAEGMSSIINAAVQESNLSGFQCSQSGPWISHLFFADDSLLFSKATDRECYTIRHILETYAAALGQTINYEKSVMCFSRAVNWSEGDRLASLIGVRHVRCHERYLGLPIFNCRNKKQLFNGIKDRVWSKIKGWKSKTLSVAEKEILIKAIIQAIPTYSMGLFRLPKGLIQDLHRLCNRFWWGSSEDRSKLHWCSWWNMCSSKEERGLGFRDLEVFNRALLTKQGWRLIRNPNSLVGKVLKSCYFSDSTFMEANPKVKGSLVWEGFLCGVEPLFRWDPDGELERVNLCRFMGIVGFLVLRLSRLFLR